MGMKRVVPLMRNGQVVHIEMTQRYYSLFEYFKERLGQQVDIGDILRDLDITLNNLRASINSLRKQVQGFYVITNKWGKYYQMDEL